MIFLLKICLYLCTNTTPNHLCSHYLTCYQYYWENVFAIFHCRPHKKNSLLYIVWYGVSPVWWDEMLCMSSVKSKFRVRSFNLFRKEEGDSMPMGHQTIQSTDENEQRRGQWTRQWRRTRWRWLTKWVRNTLKEPVKAVFSRGRTQSLYTWWGDPSILISTGSLKACCGRSNIMTNVSQHCCVWMAGVRYVVVSIVHAVWSLHLAPCKVVVVET